jgi:hypothetical protein
MYSTTSQTTKAVCEKIKFDYTIKFVATVQRKGKIYVKGTCGKQNEFALLKKACEEIGYIYTGKIN